MHVCGMCRVEVGVGVWVGVGCGWVLGWRCGVGAVGVGVKAGLSGVQIYHVATNTYKPYF